MSDHEAWIERNPSEKERADKAEASLEERTFQHRRYADGIARMLERVRKKRETGEPANSDRAEIRHLIASRDLIHKMRESELEILDQLKAKVKTQTATIEELHDALRRYCLRIVCAEKKQNLVKMLCSACGQESEMFNGVALNHASFKIPQPKHKTGCPAKPEAEKEQTK